MVSATIFEPRFLAELKGAVAAEGFPELSTQIDSLRVHEFVEGQSPSSQFIYVVPKQSVPNGELKRILVGGVPGLLCLLLSGSQIAAVETLSRDVLRRYQE